MHISKRHARRFVANETAIDIAGSSIQDREFSNSVNTSVEIIHFKPFLSKFFIYTNAMFFFDTRRINNCGYVIVEFTDGLQLIPSVWYNADNKSCIWPSHYKTKLGINSAIIRQEIPNNESDWEELPVIRFFGVADTYEKGLKKFVTAQDTSNIEAETSPNELTERIKLKRRMNARRHLSSSSDKEYEENRQSQKKIQLPSCPQLQDFMLSAPMENFETSHNLNNINNNSIHKPSVPSCSRKAAEKVIINKENNRISSSSDEEYKENETESKE